jgi:uncharacterized protein
MTCRSRFWSGKEQMNGKSGDSFFSVLTMLFLSVGFVFGGQANTQDSVFTNLCLVLEKQTVDITGSDRRLPVFPANETSDLSLVAQTMIRLYQESISSQQHNVCVFQPSCSHFGQEAIQHYGLAKGVLLIADRLQRCNNFASQYGYGYDQATGRLLDPVLNYQFRNPAYDSLPHSKASVAP